MARVALVTGGSRGIGAAISVALKAAGYAVAANYTSSDEAAAKFTAETGIATFKWSVADYDACTAGIKKVEEALGPIDILVNNAGITRDAMFHKMTPQQWNEVIDTFSTFLTKYGRNPKQRERVVEAHHAVDVGEVVVAKAPGHGAVLPGVTRGHCDARGRVGPPHEDGAVRDAAVGVIDELHPVPGAQQGGVGEGRATSRGVHRARASARAAKDLLDPAVARSPHDDALVEHRAHHLQHPLRAR
jgi:hypothetical protein